MDRDDYLHKASLTLIKAESQAKDNNQDGAVTWLAIADRYLTMASLKDN